MMPQNPNSPLLKKVAQLAHAAEAAGGRAFLVGGFVRDELLGLAPKDADVEVFGLESQALRALLEKLGRVGVVGQSFQVFKLSWHREGARHELDVSIPRRDVKVASGHRGFEVSGNPFATVEEAASRRDFTINAILRDPLTGEILDPFGGRADLNRRILRVVDRRHFGEDSLRVLRAVQFAARFELSVHPETVQLCRSTPLNDLPPERILVEVEKWLLKARRPSGGLWAARDLEVLKRLFPALDRAVERNGAVLAQQLDAGAQNSGDLEPPARLALMLALLGSHIGLRATRYLLERLKVHRMREGTQYFDVRRVVLQLVSARKTVADFARRSAVEGSVVEDKEFRFFSARIPPRLALRLARARGQTDAAAWFEDNLKRLEVLDGPPAPLVLGRDLLQLGAVPGPELGRAVQELYARQLAGEFPDLVSALQAGAALLAPSPNASHS